MALRQAKAVREVVGIDRDVAALRTAKRRGAITRTTSDLASGVSDAELIVLCVPVGLISKLAVAAAQHCLAGAIITDAGSTKSLVVDEVDAAQAVGKFLRDRSFVPGHPIAGGEQSGPQAASADLFAGRHVILTPTKSTDRTHVQQVRGMWECTGAHVSTMTPAAHDQLLAAASHLPHAVAVALSASLTAKERKHSAGGLADTTRVAAGDPNLWRDIFRANADDTVAAIDRFQSTLTELRNAIADDDRPKLTGLLRKAKRNRDAL